MLISLSFRPRRGRNCTGSRTAPKPYLTDEQWLMIADLFLEPPPSPRGGRPPVPPRPCLEGVLWILHSGARWKDLPLNFPSPATCWRRLKKWTKSGVFAEAWRRLLGQLDHLRGIDWEQAIGDGAFCPAKKGAPRSATARTAKGQSS
jgi:transposase